MCQGHVRSWEATVIVTTAHDRCQLISQGSPKAMNEFYDTEGYEGQY